MQTVINLVLMLAGGFVSYGLATGDGTYLLGGSILSGVLLILSIIDDVQMYERKKMNE